MAISKRFLGFGALMIGVIPAAIFLTCLYSGTPTETNIKNIPIERGSPTAGIEERKGEEIVKPLGQDKPIVQLNGIYPGYDTSNILFDGKNMWIAQGSHISVVSVTDRKIVATNDLGSGKNWSLAYDGKNIWGTYPGMSAIGKFAPDASITGGVAPKCGPYDIAYDGENLWAPCETYDGYVLLKLNKNGEIVSRTPVDLNYNGSVPRDSILFDGRYVLVASLSSIISINPETGGYRYFPRLLDQIIDIASDRESSWVGGFDWGEKNYHILRINPTTGEISKNVNLSGVYKERLIVYGLFEYREPYLWSILLGTRNYLLRIDPRKDKWELAELPDVSFGVSEGGRSFDYDGRHLWLPGTGPVYIVDTQRLSFTTLDVR